MSSCPDIAVACTICLVCYARAGKEYLGGKRRVSRRTNTTQALRFGRCELGVKRSCSPDPLKSWRDPNSILAEAPHFFP